MRAAPSDAEAQRLLLGDGKIFGRPPSYLDGFRAEAECLYLCDELASNRKRDG